MTKEKFKKAIDVIGLPRLIVFCFFLAIVVTAAVNGIDVASYLSSTLKYFGMWGILVLAIYLWRLTILSPVFSSSKFSRKKTSRKYIKCFSRNSLIT